MLTHAAVQIPLLAWTGWLVARPAAARHGSVWGWNADGVPGLLLAAGFSALWMLPRSMDGALVRADLEVTKFAALPLCVGAPLALSWPRLSAVARAFVWANTVPMLGAIGWLYRAAPDRACNAYLIDDQRRLGAALIGAAAVIALWAVAPAFGMRQGDRAPGDAARAGSADRFPCTAEETRTSRAARRAAALARDL